MSLFQLDPQSIVQRAGSAAPSSPVPSLAESIVRGAIAFTVVSVAGFVPWAVFGRSLHRSVGEGGMYAACALVFLGLSGPLLHRLIIGPGSRVRFTKLFALAFLPYAILWTVAWMTLRGHLGGAVGLLAGCSAMGLIIAAAFDAWKRAAAAIAVLFIGNVAGYFIGGVVEAVVFPHYKLAAMLLWGVCYGLGFGAGLGWTFHLCQQRARELLAGSPGV